MTHMIQLEKQNKSRKLLTPDFPQVVDLKHDSKADIFKTASFKCADGYVDDYNGGYSPALDAFYFGTKVMEMFSGECYTYSTLLRMS